MSRACASCGGDETPWRRGWTVKAGERALLCNACGLRWSAGRGEEEVLSEPPRKKRRSSLPAAAAPVPIAARVAPPCFGPRESEPIDDGGTEVDGADAETPRRATRRSPRGQTHRPSAGEPFEGEILPETFHPTAVPTILRQLGPGRWCGYAAFRERSPSHDDDSPEDDAKRKTRTFELVAEDGTALRAVVGTASPSSNHKYRYEVCDGLVAIAMDGMGRPFASPPAPGHLRNARDVCAWLRAVVRNSSASAADESFRDRVTLAVAVDDAVRREDLGGTWRALERAMGRNTWRWATGSAGELAVARLHEMVRRVDEGAAMDVRGRNALTARDAAEIVSELRCVWMRVDGGINMETLEETGIARAVAKIASMEGHRVEGHRVEGHREVIAKETADAARGILNEWRGLAAGLVATLETFLGSEAAHEREVSVSR